MRRFHCLFPFVIVGRVHVGLLLSVMQPWELSKGIMLKREEDVLGVSEVTCEWKLWACSNLYLG